jgi:hypothetical protein
MHIATRLPRFPERPPRVSNVRVEEIVRKLIPLFIIITLFACKKFERQASVAARAVVTDTAAAEVAGASLPQALPQQQALPRMIVRTANVRIIVADTSKAVDAITNSVEALGGYVAGSRIWRDGELLRATLTLRVPSDKLTTTLTSVRGIAKRVDNETISSDDVSQEYVDLESQLRNLEATEIELRELMTTIRKNAQKAEEVLQMHQQIASIRSQIEQTKGRMRYLSQVAAMSTVSLEVVPDFVAQPVVKPGWQPVVIMKDASRALVGVLRAIVTALIWVVLYVLPIVGMLMLVASIAWKVYRRTRTRAA